MTPNIDLGRQQYNVLLFVETEQCVWQLRLIDPINMLVEVESSDPRLKAAGPRIAKFDRSISGTGLTNYTSIVKGWAFVLEFADCRLVTSPVQSASIENDGWKFEAIQPDPVPEEDTHERRSKTR
jgi:hypothetical protein